MRWIARIFANAIARRVAFVVVAIALAWCGIGESRAQSRTCVDAQNRCTYPTREEAYAGCMADGAAGEPQSGRTKTGNICQTGIGVYTCRITQTGFPSDVVCGSLPNSNPGPRALYTSHYWSQECPAGTEWNEATKTCDEDCAARPNRQWNPGQVGIVNGSTTCDDGCTGVIVNNLSSPGYTVSYGAGVQCEAPPFPNGCSEAQRAAGWRNSTIVAGVCIPPTQSCPDGTARNPITGECGQDACPAGMTLNAMGQCEPEGDNCPAGQTKAPDGSCQSDNDNCPAGQVKGADGTCKPDADDDGEADEDDGSFSGGETCDTPPLCSGDAILCGQARIQWRIDCNTRSDAKINGGGCDAVPICTGRNCNALEYAQLLQQWRSACALEKLAQDGMSNGSGDGPTEGWDSTVDAQSVADITAGTGDPADAFTDGSENNGGAGGQPGGDGELDSTGLGYGSTCPNLPSIDVLGTTVDFNAAVGGAMCDWFKLAGQIVLILAALLSVRILSSSTGV